MQIRPALPTKHPYKGPPMEELSIGIHSLTEIAIGKQLIVCLRDFLNSLLSINEKMLFHFWKMMPEFIHFHS